MNVRIRALGREMQVPVADPEPLFLKDPDFDRLYTDHVHPNNSGYDHIAQAFFQAIITPTTTTTLVRARRAHPLHSSDFPAAHARDHRASGYSGSRIERVKTGRLLKFQRPGGDVQAYLYQEAGVFRASVFVLGPSGRKDEPLPDPHRRLGVRGRARAPGLGRSALPQPAEVSAAVRPRRPPPRRGCARRCPRPPRR